MFEQNGLSLDQAPPISVVLGFFLIGSLFGIFSGASILYYGNQVFDISSTGAIVTIHLLALGFAMSFMLGALFQMLPVIAGVTIQNPITKTKPIQISIILGIVSLLSAFIIHTPLLFLSASIFLGSSLLYVAFIMGTKLYKLSNHSASSRGMLYAVMSLVIFVLLALYMTSTYAQIHSGVYFGSMKKLHYTFALFGWMTLLIESISFQTVEMFYVTPPYPKKLSKFTPIISFSILIIISIMTLSNNILEKYMMLLLYSILIVYASYTLLRLSQRKRPLADATIWFWRIAMSSLIASMSLPIINNFIQSKSIFDLSVVFFVSFVMSVIFAMFYKIVPFLTWFHLNAQGYFSAPMMHEVIHPKTAKKHMWLHLSMILFFLLSIFVSQAIYMAGILMIASFIWTSYHIIHAQKLYKYTQENSEKFDMGSVNLNNSKE